MVQKKDAEMVQDISIFRDILHESQRGAVIVFLSHNMVIFASTFF